jgi:Putative ATP-dependent DNA helicase recG C-terminal/SIR2-like domain
MQHKQQRKTSIFSICALPDIQRLERWEIHLRPLEQAGLLSVWSVRHLQAGLHRNKLLHDQLDRADLIVLLLSADFFTDNECLALMESALARHQQGTVRVIPLLLRPLAFRETELATLTPLPSNGSPITQWPDPEAAFDDCVRELRRILDGPVNQEPSIARLESQSVQTTAQETSVEHLYTIMTRSEGPGAVLLLGAGASVKSGIPLSGELVERAAKWAYCRTFGRHVDDPAVRRSDWLPWLQKRSWYHKDSPPSDNYSAVIEYLLQPRESRKAFLLSIVNSSVPASKGYEQLVEFMAQRIVRTILTTNFDMVLPDLCRTRHRPHYVEILKTPSDFIKFSTSPTYPQLIYLHGSIEHYSDKNLLDEVRRLDENLITHIFPLLRDHPLIVVGYRGAEPSIMRHLLLENAPKANNYHQGIFWCARQDTINKGFHPMVNELAHTIGGNFQVVPIEGFDELFEQIWVLHQRQTQYTSMSPIIPQQSVIAAPTFDMRVIADSSLDELDWSRVQGCITTYCKRMDVSVPNPVTHMWLIERLYELDLAYEQNGLPALTIAGYLLFARNPLKKIRSAEVALHISGENERVFTGHLWNQLEQITEALEEINQPFRLKGTISETVFPYPHLALKELVVNALVHRSYKENQRVLIEVEPTHIRITNPGGLVDEVIQRVLQPLQAEIEQGRRGIKGYRNPVIADVFYSAGAMDKAGSGLADVQKWVNENEGKVVFGPQANNSQFEVELFRRPETVDEVTGTATPLAVTARYLSNLLEVTAWPETIWHASTTARRPADVWKGMEGLPLPAFLLADAQLYTFADLRDPTNPFYGKVNSRDVRMEATVNFMVGEEGERRFVFLLNQCLLRYLRAQGLIVDRKRRRAYFPRSESGSREITYQARLRRATRTVTKPIISKTTQRVRYWEHEAVRFSFSRFGDTWALHLVPGYVFTVNGFKPIEGPKVGSLATRRAARDYNQQVHNDLIFWLWVLAQGSGHCLLDTGSSQCVELRAQYASCMVRDVVPPPNTTELDIADLPDMAEIEEELDELITMMYPDLDSEGTIDDNNN